MFLFSQMERLPVLVKNTLPGSLCLLHWLIDLFIMFLLSHRYQLHRHCFPCCLSSIFLHPSTHMIKKIYIYTGLTTEVHRRDVWPLLGFHAKEIQHCCWITLVTFSDDHSNTSRSPLTMSCVCVCVCDCVCVCKRSVMYVLYVSVWKKRRKKAVMVQTTLMNMRYSCSQKNH